MPRIRTVKPEFWSDEKLSTVSRDARLLLIGLLNFADDAGRMRGSPLLIRAQVFPYDTDIDSESLLRILAERSLIVRYEVDGESYIWIRNFTKHQKIDHPSDSVLPGPPAGKSQRHSAKAPRTLAEPSLLERKGKEGNGVTTSSAEQPTEPVRIVFEHWRDKHRIGRKALLDKKRRAAIDVQFKLGRSVDDLCRAVEGCLRDPFSMGQNDRSTKYNDISLICRDAAHVEKFMALCPQPTGPPAPPKKTDAQIQAEAIADYERANGRV